MFITCLTEKIGEFQLLRPNFQLIRALKGTGGLQVAASFGRSGRGPLPGPGNPGCKPSRLDPVQLVHHRPSGCTVAPTLQGRHVVPAVMFNVN